VTAGATLGSATSVEAVIVGTAGLLFPKSAANHPADLDFGSGGTETLSVEIVFFCELEAFDVAAGAFVIP
jgi:hypothetical protein